MCAKNESNPSIPWPVAAASRVRLRCIDHNTGRQQNNCRGCTTASEDEQQFYRLFYNESSKSVEVVPTRDEFDTNARQVYNDADIGVEDEPTYKSYIATMNDSERTVVDSFGPDDVIGANLSLEYNIQNPNTFHGMQRYSSNASINIYAYPKMKKGKICNGGRRAACHKKYAIDPRGCEDFGDVRKVIDAIRNLARLRPHFHGGNEPIRYLVILNPFSGGGGVASKTGSKCIYETLLNPMLEQAGVEHDVLVTGRGGHARDRMKARTSDNPGTNETEHLDDKLSDMITDTETKDISEYAGIIAMGGDGILFEIMQGIHAREDERVILKTLKFGIVGCGTSNGLAKSILHWSDVSFYSDVQSVYCKLQTHTHDTFYDNTKENYGPLESIFHICKGNTAPLDIASYQLANTSKSYISFLTFTWGLIADCDLDSECLRWLGSLRQDIWAVYRGILFPKVYRAKFSYLPPEKHTVGEPVSMPEFGKPLPEDWVTIEDDFRVFWVSNVSHPAYNMHLCPMSKMNDGLFHIVIVR